MNRKSFLKRLGLAGVGLSMPASQIFAKDGKNTNLDAKAFPKQII